MSKWVIGIVEDLIYTLPTRFNSCTENFEDLAEEATDIRFNFAPCVLTRAADNSAADEGKSLPDEVARREHAQFES